MDPDHDDDHRGPEHEVLAGRSAEVAGLPVVRLLPRPTRRTIGAWCFLDSFGPVGPDGPAMEVGPHPHIGLHTVTWLLDGEVVHRDSLGSEQPIRPGQLNLMTAGRGISHAEESARAGSGGLHGAQLWVAQPEATRHGAPAFEHHEELPVVGIGGRGRGGGGGARATVLIGELGGVRSPARADTPLLGLEVRLDGEAAFDVDPAFEHGVALLAGRAALDGSSLAAGTTAYLAPGREQLRLAGDAATLLVLGGLPFPDRLFMWWNFVGRDASEIEAARADWEEGSRFGTVSSTLDRVPAPAFGG